jgi:hypothetical protein
MYGSNIFSATDHYWKTKFPYVLSFTLTGFLKTHTLLVSRSTQGKFRTHREIPITLPVPNKHAGKV